MVNYLSTYLRPHYIFAGLSIGAFLLTTLLPRKFDASLYHLDFSAVFENFEIWRLFTCLLVAGQFFRGFKLAELGSYLNRPSLLFSRFLPYLVLQSGVVQLYLSCTHLKRLYMSAIT
jgi:hypothetical protein